MEDISNIKVSCGSIALVTSNGGSHRQGLVPQLFPVSGSTRNANFCHNYTNIPWVNLVLIFYQLLKLRSIPRIAKQPDELLIATMPK